MATLNLYLPDALKGEMDQIEGVNWSAEAQGAFRLAINREKAKSMDTTAIAERLKGTAGSKSEWYRKGFEEGKEWAAQDATQDDLELLDQLYRGDEQALEIALDVGDNGQTAATWLAEQLECDLDSLFIQAFDGNVKMTTNRFRGFVEGALEVYDQVKSHL